jgi:glycosyltransferase involved in cell wall biosynthesis
MFRHNLGFQPDHVVVVLAGRINRWKGQDVLVATASELYRQGEQNCRYLIVGSPPNGQEHFRTNLLKQIDTSPARETIRLLDFTDEIATVWASCDIAVVPSTEPEPFGLVALEAMAAGKPVIAANHGGLPEIIQDGISGILVKPGSSNALAEAIKVLSHKPQLRERMGSTGKGIQAKTFSINSYVDSFRDLYNSTLES